MVELSKEDKKALKTNYQIPVLIMLTALLFMAIPTWFSFKVNPLYYLILGILALTTYIIHKKKLKNTKFQNKNLKKINKINVKNIATYSFLKRLIILIPLTLIGVVILFSLPEGYSSLAIVIIIVLFLAWIAALIEFYFKGFKEVTTLIKEGVSLYKKK